MGLEGIGSSVVIALAAVLWLVYLIPNWVKRREYLATERNAIRLQQTLRILAHTAELPDAVIAESTAKSVALQKRMLRQEVARHDAVRRAQEAAVSRAAGRTLAALEPAVPVGGMLTNPASDTSARMKPAIARPTAATRLRRARAATSGILLLSIAAVVAGLTAAASAALVVGGAIVGVLAVAVLNRMATVARSRRHPIASANARQTATPRSAPLFDVAPVADAHAVEPLWTPVQLPKPLYLSRPAAQSVDAELAIVAARARIVADAEREEAAREAAEADHKLTRIEAASESRFARMGIVDDELRPSADLDATLRRRRAV